MEKDNDKRRVLFRFAVDIIVYSMNYWCETDAKMDWEPVLNLSDTDKAFLIENAAEFLAKLPIYKHLEETAKKLFLYNGNITEKGNLRMPPKQDKQWDLFFWEPEQDKLYPYIYIKGEKGWEPSPYFKLFYHYERIESPKMRAVYKERIKEYEFYGDIIYEGDYLNGERNGRGKEYKYKSIIYEGEYKNGKRHGYGKDYRYEHVIFEGKYIDGKKWDGWGCDRDGVLLCKFEKGKGFIKVYEGWNRAISFEGEFNNGEGNGKAKEYDFHGKLIYEGEYKDGKRHGKGIEYYNYYSEREIIFNGEYINGKIWRGFGKPDFSRNLFIGEYRYGEMWKGKEMYTNDTISFEGEYLNGKKWKGKFYYENGNLRYDGELSDDKLWNGILYSYDGKEKFEIKNGKGKIKEYIYYSYTVGLSFEGEILNGLKNGEGKEYFTQKDIDNIKIKFEGEYLNDKKWNGIGYNINGEKQYEIKNGTGYIYEYDRYNKLLFEGEVIRGIKTGKAKEYISGYLYFDGFYLNDKKEGRGKIFDFQNNIDYEGNFCKGMKNGYGKEYRSGKLLYEGEFMNDKSHGKGKYYYNNSQLMHEGEYFNGVFFKGKEYSSKGILIKEFDYFYNFKNKDSSYKTLWKGKQYNDNGIIVYEGSTVNEKMWTGIGYDPMGKKAYEIKDGKGKIKKYYETGELKFDTGYLYGYICGDGKKYYKNGNVKYVVKNFKVN